MTDGEAFIASYLILFFVAMLIVGLPIFIAFWREHPNRWPILVLTVALGATIIGWLVALIWSLHGIHRSKGAVVNGGESGLNLFANDIGLAPRDAVSPSTTAVQVGGIAWAALQLERITRLRNQGFISAEEHVALKALILKRASH